MHCVSSFLCRVRYSAKPLPNVCKAGDSGSEYRHLSYLCWTELDGVDGNKTITKVQWAGYMPDTNSTLRGRHYTSYVYIWVSPFRPCTSTAAHRPEAARCVQCMPGCLSVRLCSSMNVP
jgi:hypothetical protein